MEPSDLFTHLAPVLNVGDLAAERAFYEKLLGEPAWQDSGYVGWMAGSGMLMIGSHSEVKGRNETTFDERLRMDIDYIRTRSFRTDTRIFMLTFLSVVRRSGE